MVNANRVLPLVSRAPLCLAILVASGCAYLLDRGRDFGECVRVEGGTLPGLGIGVKAAGLAHLGLGAGCVPREWWPKAGWEYGSGYVGSWFPSGFGGDRSGPSIEGYPPCGLFGFGHVYFLHIEGYACKHRTPSQTHNCALLLPAAFSRVRMGDLEDSLLWESGNPWPRVHAFDAEVAAHLLLLGARVGVSPGELTDFLLGWFGVDIAGDDRRDGEGPYEIEAAIEKAEEELEDEE